MVIYNHNLTINGYFQLWTESVDRQDYRFEMDDWTDFWGHGTRTTDDKHFHQIDGGGRVDRETDETDGRFTNYFPWRLYSINGLG